MTLSEDKCRCNVSVTGVIALHTSLVPLHSRGSRAVQITVTVSLPGSEGVIPVTPETYLAELAADETPATHLDEYRRSARAALCPPSEDLYPQTVFLGTGSSIPNKKRNTSGILVNLRWAQTAGTGGIGRTYSLGCCRHLA